MRLRLSLVLIAAMAVLSGLFSASALASSKQEVTFEAPRDLIYPGTRSTAFDEISAFGVKAIRVVLYWKDVAPNHDSRIRPNVDFTDPSVYDWSKYQPILDEAKGRGIDVQLTITTPAPRWATKGARDYLTYPNPTRFQEFVTAVSRQFGSKVTRYSILNEPNLPQFLKPQYVKRKAVSPTTYRGLYEAAMRGLAANNDRKPVLMGETAPNGAAPRTVPPIEFLQKTLCLNSRYRKVGKCKKVRVNGWAHHAYTRKDGPLATPKTSRLVTIGVLSRLTGALDRAAKADVIRRGMPIYLTEFGIQSVPDRNYGVSLQQQNEFRAIAEKIAYGNKRVVAFSQYLLTDDNPTGTGSKCCGGFESGLRTYKGKNKPSYDGFRLPLVATRSGSAVALWGIVRPAEGSVNLTIERRSGSRWVKVKSKVTNSRGVWSTRTVNKKGASWRVKWVGPDGTTYASPAVRAYTWPKRLR